MILQIDISGYITLIEGTLIYFAIYGIYVLSLNLEAGYLGIPQFGKVMFLALGGLAVGGIATKIAIIIYGGLIQQKFGLTPIEIFQTFDQYCNSRYSSEVASYISSIFASSPLDGVLFFLLSLIIAAVLSGAFGVLISGPALRLREDYLGILLLVSAETIRVITTNITWLACGVQPLPVPNPFAWMGEAKQWGYLLLVLAFLAFTFVVVERLGNSPFGRSLRALRDAETAARIFGKDVVRFRIRVLTVASILGGIAGVLLTFYTENVNMQQFKPKFTFQGWAMLVVGGLGNNVGALLGVTVYLFLDDLITIYKESIKAIINIDPVNLQYIIFGVIIILMLIFRPRGLVGEKPARTLPRRLLQRLSSEAVAESAKA